MVDASGDERIAAAGVQVAAIIDTAIDLCWETYELMLRAREVCDEAVALRAQGRQTRLRQPPLASTPRASARDGVASL